MRAACPSSADAPHHRESDRSSRNALVLGAIRGYEWPQLEPFVHSLIDVGFEGDTVLFAARTPTQTVSTLRDHGITVIPYREFSLPMGYRNLRPEHVHLFSWARSRLCRELLKRKPSLLNSRKLLQAIAPLYGVWSGRYLLYLDYLLSLSPSRLPDLVLLTDIRDVVFQQDPSLLATELSSGLTVSLEDPSMTIGSCPENSEWINATYSQSILHSLHDLPISCAGVTFGSCPAVIDYLRGMVEQLLTVRRADHGTDQAVHNYLLRSGTLPPFREFANGEGPVLTLGTVSMFELDKDGAVLNNDGSLPTVVHQYDRHPSLAREHLFKKSSG